MYAVIDLKGHQWIVRKGEKIDVDNMGLKEGEIVEVDKILLAFDEDQKNIKVGKPYINGKVILKVEKNFKGEKIWVKKFKNKIRADRNSKGKGFRPMKTRLIVEEISL